MPDFNPDRSNRIDWVEIAIKISTQVRLDADKTHAVIQKTLDELQSRRLIVVQRDAYDSMKRRAMGDRES